MNADPASLAIGATASGLQAAFGLVQTITGGAKTKKLLAQRQAYKTPEQIFKILQATESMQGGFDPQTLQYLTGQVDQGIASSLDAATLLGADPNQLSSLFDKKIQATMEIGAKNHFENLKNFEKYISAEGLVADNLAAEQKSQQDILKDKLQAASTDKAAGAQNIAGGINSAISTAASAATGKLYNDKKLSIDQLLNLIKNTSGSVDYSHGGYGS